MTPLELDQADAAKSVRSHHAAECRQSDGDEAEGAQYQVGGASYAARDPQLQVALADAYRREPRPRCLCVPGGVEMYVARLDRHVLKRMPETGPQQHPACSSYEPEAGVSGLAELLGQAIKVDGDGYRHLYLDFPLTRRMVTKEATAPSLQGESGRLVRQRMGLRSVLRCGRPVPAR